jgi:hypothetical protein
MGLMKGECLNVFLCSCAFVFVFSSILLSLLCGLMV